MSFMVAIGWLKPINDHARWSVSDESFMYLS
jgi:hypothetical protein